MAILTPPLPPQPLGMSDGVYATHFPPFHLITNGVEGSVVRGAERHDPLVADLAPDGPRLGKT